MGRGVGGRIDSRLCVYLCLCMRTRVASFWLCFPGSGFSTRCRKAVLEPLDPSRHAAGLPRGLLLPDPVLRAAREYRRFYHSCEENFIMEKRY